jgi:type IV pilus assembly protein PilM
MVGLDVSDRSIKVVEISEGDTPKLRTVCWSALAPHAMRRGIIQDAAVVGAAIEDSLTKCSPVSVVGRTVAVSIPETQSFVRVIELPQMNNKEMDEAVQWAIRHHIPFDLDRVYLDWQILKTIEAGEGETLGRQQVLVGAAQRDVIDPLLQVLDDVGLRVVALELEAQAIVRAILPTDARDVMGVLVVDLGATSTNVIYFDEGSMRYTTSIQRGGDDLTQELAQELRMDPNIAAEKKALVGVSANEDNSQVSQTLRTATFDLVNQINKVARDVAAQFAQSTGIKIVLLTGGSANLPGLIDMFATSFPGVPVQLGNPFINLTSEDGSTTPPLSPADSAHFTTAIGLALRRNEFI